MPTYPHIESYYKELEDIIQFGGPDNELSIRKAFQNCLSEYCSNHRENLKLIPELAAQGGIPDGTVKDSLRMARGYWEAKDTHDDLDAEIQAKFNQGYPRYNIFVEDSQTAILYQNREQAMRVDTIQPISWQPILVRKALPQVKSCPKPSQHSDGVDVGNRKLPAQICQRYSPFDIRIEYLVSYDHSVVDFSVSR